MVAASTLIDGPGVPVADEGRTHVADGQVITYTNYPPSSGTHYNSPALQASIQTPFKRDRLYTALSMDI